MNRLRKVGVALFLFGLVIEAGSWLWNSTRQWHPVDMPISLSPGRISTTEFEANISTLYEIRIDFQKNIPFHELNCRLGMSSTSCYNNPSVVEATWILYSGTKIVAQGRSNGNTDGNGWGNQVISRGLGIFYGKHGRCKLVVNFLKDGSILASCNPRLRVVVDPEASLGIQIWRAFIFLAAIVLCLSGISLFLYSVLKKSRQKITANEGRVIPGG